MMAATMKKRIYYRLDCKGEEEGRKEEGRRKKAEGRRKKEEGRRGE